ncbi:MAG: hypothetical protein AB8F74_18135 [Saprospiraceae bacterium]
MKFISESEIDKVTDLLSTDSNQEAFFKTIGEEQPVLLSFLVSENIKVLTTEEQELMFFLAAVIFDVIKNEYPDIPMLTEDVIGKLEEANWYTMEANVRGNFSERITPFFENYPQEDLLAFVEDSLVFDEDSHVTNEGRSYLFVILKTVIDAFDKTL